MCIHYKPFIISCVIGNSFWTAMTKTVHRPRVTSKKQDTVWVWVMCHWYHNFENKQSEIYTFSGAALFGSNDRRPNAQRHLFSTCLKWWPSHDNGWTCRTSTREAISACLKHHPLPDSIHFFHPSLPYKPLFLLQTLPFVILYSTTLPFHI